MRNFERWEALPVSFCVRDVGKGDICALLALGRSSCLRATAGYARRVSCYNDAPGMPVIVLLRHS